MVKILQFVCMIWSFISICFLKFRTYMWKGQKQGNEVEDILKWQREEVSKLGEVLKVKEVLNKKQCINLVAKLGEVVLYMREIVISTKETPNKFGLVLEELCCITRKVKVLVEECGKQEWCHAAAFQMNNIEAFRELVDDLKCLWDAMCTRYLAIYADSQNYRFLCIDFHVASCEDIESDEKGMVERLEDRCQTMPNDSEEYELARHLLRRLKFDLQGGQGAELNALELLEDAKTPEVLKRIGCGAVGEVYESRWLGLRSATKMLKVLPNFHKEAGILACLSHPNLVKFICCGRFNEFVEDSMKKLIVSRVTCEVNKSSWFGHQNARKLFKVLPKLIKLISCGRFDESHEDTFEVLKNGRGDLFLVMELMETSLSDLLKKQKTPLPYLVAINIMLEIAKGMCYLHDMHVAHLDLKPDNVLLSSKSRLVGGERNIGYDFVKLADYDCSKTEVPSKPEPQKYTIGTPKYMAPEMNSNKETPLGNVASPFQADVWSFAMTCSEILSCKEPFWDTKSRVVILQRIKDCLRPKLPMNCKELTMLIEECWVEDPSQRPTFGDICERLAILKRKFMVGTYPNDNPQFDKDGSPSPNMQLKASNHMSMSTPKKVNEQRTQHEVVVGLESNLANVGYHLKQVNILGLIGMGGIGKTTLAKAIFDDVKCTYDASCFLENLKNKSSLEILCEILKNIESDKETNWELMGAQKRMMELLATKKVFLILDDPKDVGQVDDIIPEDVSCWNNGTKIIITTRVWGVIKNRVDVNGKIDVGKLDDDGAKELFDSYILVNGAQLSAQIHDLRGKIIETCNGLPLSLKVMGAFLRGKKRIRSWERAFQRMKRGRCLDGDEGLWSTLRISFDGLERNEKNMFLDIACLFPKGMEKERALHIFTNYGSFPNHVLDVLVDKSLVVINKRASLEMHDQLCDMGRMIAEEDRYRGARIWKKHMIPLANASTHDKKYKKVKAIYLDEEIMQWLLDNCMAIEDLDVSSLRMLICWRLKTSLKRLGNMTSLTTICLLECSSLTILPEGLKNLTSLRTLDLRKCQSLTTLPQGLGNLTSLTTLDLRSCERLTTLPEGLGNLTSLTSLDLSLCLRLGTLTEGLRNLTSLTTLNLQSCSMLRTLPEGLGNLTSLTTLDLRSCSMLRTLPEGLGNLTSLTTLDLQYCSSLITLPEGLGNLTSLTTLDLGECLNLTTLPKGLGNLTSLTRFYLGPCSSLTTLPEGLWKLISLTTLVLEDFSSLTTMPEGLGNLTSLTNLDLQGCLSLITLPEGLGNLTLLTRLDLRYCSSLRTLPVGLGNLTSLTTLDLRLCERLTTLPDVLANLICLTTLDLRYCVSLITLPGGLGNLTSLTTFNLGHCSSLTTLPEGLGNLTSLKRLDLGPFLSLATLSKGLWNLISLTILVLEDFSSLTTLPDELGNLTSLTSLDLWSCWSLTTLPEGLGNLTSLTNLDLRCCKSLTTLPEGLGNLTSLTTLDLQGCLSLTTLPEGLGNLISLKILVLHHCSRLTILPEGLGNLTSLTRLDLRYCSSLRTLPMGLGNLTYFTTLDLQCCKSLTTLPEGLGKFTSLTSLDLAK